MTSWFEGLFINRVGLCDNELSNLAIFIKKPMGQLGQSMPGTSFEHVFALECATTICNWYNYEAHSPWLKLWRLSKIQNLNVAGLKKKATLPKMAVTSSVLENEVGQADFNFKTQASQTLRELQNA